MKKPATEKECKRCGGTFPVESFGKAGESSSGNMTYTGWCKKCFVTRRSEIHNERVLRAVEELGKKLSCIICGYDKCVSSLDFHHLDPSIKEKGIGQMRGHNFDRIKEEISKCVVLCKNCHSEVHAGITVLDVFSKGICK